jgi:hypothetical protein
MKIKQTDNDANFRERMKERYSGRKFYRPSTGKMEEVEDDFAEELRKASELLRRER